MAYNAKLTGTFYGERFYEKMKRSGMHKNERSKMFPRAAFCYVFYQELRSLVRFLARAKQPNAIRNPIPALLCPA